MTQIIETIRPYSYKREELQVGRIINGEFVQERGVWNVLKDTRLTVKRSYEGRGASQDVTFTVNVPAGYSLVIAKVGMSDVNSTSRTKNVEILFNPEAEAVKKNVPSFFAALAQFAEQAIASVKVVAKRIRRAVVKPLKTWAVTERNATTGKRTVWIEAVSRAAAKALYEVENGLRGNSRLTASVVK